MLFNKYEIKDKLQKLKSEHNRPFDPKPLSIIKEKEEVSFLEMIQEKILYPDKPKIGLVIGTFAAVPYINLQLEARKRLYPNVPILVHDDCSHKKNELKLICEQYGCEFEYNSHHIATQSKGDLTAFIGGLRWAQINDYDILVKFSRRFIPIIDWQKSLVDLAVKSQYPTFSSYTTSYDYGFRTECMAMSVHEWHRLNLVADLIKEVLNPTQIFVEGMVHQLAKKAAQFIGQKSILYDKQIGKRPHNKNGYAIWNFMGFDRRTRSNDFLWHDSVKPQDYHALSTKWGLPYALKDFENPNQ